MHDMMGGPGTMGLWVLLGLGLLAVAAAGVWVGRARRGRHGRPGQLPPPAAPGLAEAQAALRLRYAHGEISREDYLQGKVELED